MSEITVKGVAGLKGVDFIFTSGLESLNPLKPAPDSAFTDGEISISTIAAKASKKFSLGPSGKKVEFGLDGEIEAGLGVYRKTAKLVNALKREGVSSPLADLSHIEIGSSENLFALRWGYGFGAVLNGTLGLGKGAGTNVKFGASGQMSGMSVLLHKRRRDENLIDSIKGTLESWRLPRQIATAGDLPAGTAVIYETMGKLALSLGVQYGYDFSWSKKDIEIGSLSGDLGLKIEMAIKAQFGYSATGRYALAITRPSAEQTLRVQVFRIKQNDWSFALDGSFNAQVNKVPFPNNIDAFIKGVFNLNGSQVLKDFEKFLDPKAKLQDLIGKGFVDYSRDLVGHVTGVDPLDIAEKGVAEFKELIEQWHKLPHEVSSFLYAIVNEAVDLKELKSFLKKLVTAAKDPKKITALITAALPQHTFAGVVEKWLIAASNKALSTLLADLNAEREILAARASDTLALLDGGALEKRLKKLQSWIEEKLSIDKILELEPDEWLKKRLADFLGKQSVVTKDLEAIRAAIINIRSSANRFYEKGYEALLEKYKFEFHYAFHRSTSSDALIDVTLDFAGGNLDGAKASLSQILDGNFAPVAESELPWVKINRGVFTHSIRRSTHIEIGLPYFKAFADHVTESSASGEIVDKDGDRLWVFNLRAFDEVRKKKSLSRLSIEASLTESSELRRFTAEAYRTNYKFLYAKKGARRSYLNTRYALAVDEYFNSALPSWGSYLDELDRSLDANGMPGSNRFGNLLTSWEVSVPSSVIAAWKRIPNNPRDDFYWQMSFAVQRRLRQWIPVAYIDDDEKYEDTADIYPLLAYAALPSFRLELAPRVYYWNFGKRSTREEVFDTHCLTNLQSRVLPPVHQLTGDARYAVSDADVLRDIRTAMVMSDSFRTLCKFEEETISGIADVADAFHKFLKTPASKAERKIELLAEFGQKFTDAFNDDLGHIRYTPKGALRPLGLILIHDLAKLLDPRLADAGFSAMLELCVLRDGVDFEKARKSFFAGTWPKPGDAYIQHRILGP